MTNPRVGQQFTFPPIPTDSWRADAACAGHKDLTLWDASIPLPEKDAARHIRQAKAAAICNTRCDVREQCAADADWRFDEGVRGGHVLPMLNARQGANASLRDQEMLRLLRAGVPLDEAARIVRRRPGKAS